MFGFDVKAKEKVCPIWGIPPRDFLQIFGTEVCRDDLAHHLPQMEHLWVRLLEANMLVLQCDVVIDDLRFQDEELMLRHHGATIVRIGSAPASFVTREEGSCGPSSHRSETYCPKADFILPRLFNDNYMCALAKHEDEKIV